jgi:hypothetical protein
LLWICCRDASEEQNAVVEQMAAEGGYMLGCAVEVTENDQMHWAIVAGPTANHPMRALFEEALAERVLH